jgi:hypothetical protein
MPPKVDSQIVVLHVLEQLVVPTKYKRIKLFLFVLAIAILAIAIFVVVIYFKFKKTQSTPIILNDKHTVASKIELYPETDYKKGDKNAAYPSYIEITNIKEQTQYDNILVKSLKVKNCKITLFSENNYTGETMIIDDKYNEEFSLRSEPLLKGFKSVTITPYYQNEYELYTDNDFKDGEQNIEININSREINVDKIREAKIKEAKKKRDFNISKEVKINDTYINSVRSYGLILTLYSEPDFTGRKMVLSGDIIKSRWLPQTVRSIIIEPKDKITI